jgi:hypothetical protein
MGHLVETLSPEVVEFLKKNFDSEINKIEELIINSELFYDDIKNVNPEYRGCYRSKRYKKGDLNSNGIVSITWSDKWSEFHLRISTKNTESFKTLGFNNPTNYYPLYLKEGKEYDHINESTFESFKQKEKLYQLNLTNDEINFVYSLQKKINEIVSDIQSRILVQKEILEVKKSSVFKDLDRDGNSFVDLVDGESFNKLLKKNQSFIVNKNESYIQKFVKVSIYLNTKKNNTQKIFNSIKETKNDVELNELVNLLKNQIHTYNSLVFHSISMITSLVENDLITFYEIYECFDQLGVFNSNWENEVSNKLTNIEDGIKELMYSIYEMENKIVSSIEHLTYVTQDSFNDLEMSISRELQDIDSSIQVNNLLTGIQTYQMYKINQKTKSIN